MPDTKAKAWNGAMSAQHFMARFGGACRRKHVEPLPSSLPGWLRLGRRHRRTRELEKHRLYPLREEAPFPAGFIGLDPWEAEYLFLVGALAERGVVEIGRRVGGSTFLLACANVVVPIWSIDIEPEGDEELAERFRRYKVGKNVELLVGNSHADDFPEIGDFDLLFVDGNHRYAGCKGDLESFFSRLAPGGSMLVHDCYGAREVQRAVLDFVAEHPGEVELVRGYIPAAHWRTDHGSLAHLRKAVE